MDIRDLIRLLNENAVDYIIIGASSFPYYGYVRNTLDTDILIRPGKDNAEKALKCLQRFGFDTKDITAQEMLNKKILFRQYDEEVDIHPEVKGASFKQLWENKNRGKIAGEDVFFPSLVDLIEMKKAAGRAKDREDLKYLNRLKKKKEKNED
ncbi:MAG: hypothetical protein U9R36_02915 [Elusimicrobiota bacterium]|nr:hypothetical protein [Elusimicrobiota bacterium]